MNTNSEHKDPKQLHAELEACDIEVGQQFAHYKDESKTYTVVNLAFLESTNDLCVVYRADYDPDLTFVRPLSVWIQDVEWNGQTKQRFRPL